MHLLLLSMETGMLGAGLRVNHEPLGLVSAAAQDGTE